MIIKKNNSVSKSILNYSFTVKDFIITILMIMLLLLFVIILYLQNKQIQDLLGQIVILQEELNGLQNNLSNLKSLIDEKIVTPGNPQNLQLDSEIIRAQTERQEIYIRTALILACSIAVVSIGVWAIGGWSSAFTIKAWLPTQVVSFGKTLGFFTTVNTYTKMHENVCWKVKVVDAGADLKIFVKIPGTGEFSDAMVLLSNHLQSEIIKSTNTVISDNLAVSLVKKIDTTANVSSDLLTAPGVIQTISSPVITDIVNALPSLY